MCAKMGRSDRYESVNVTVHIITSANVVWLLRKASSHKASHTVSYYINLGGCYVISMIFLKYIQYCSSGRVYTVISYCFISIWIECFSIVFCVVCKTEIKPILF